MTFTETALGLVVVCLLSTGLAARAEVLAGPITNLANGHSYYLLAPDTWTQAEAEAVSLGGHLVTINNAAEDAWVYDTFASYGDVARALWIGLFQLPGSAEPDAGWVWASGEAVTYTSWNMGEPNDLGGNQNYAHIYPPNDPGGRARLWNDIQNVASQTIQGVMLHHHGVVEVVPNPVTGLFYATDFQQGVGSKWSNPQTTVNPAGHGYLGRFSN